MVLEGLSVGVGGSEHLSLGNNTVITVAMCDKVQHLMILSVWLLIKREPLL